MANSTFSRRGRREGQVGRQKILVDLTQYTKAVSAEVSRPRTADHFISSVTYAERLSGASMVEVRSAACGLLVFEVETAVLDFSARRSSPSCRKVPTSMSSERGVMRPESDKVPTSQWGDGWRACSSQSEAVAGESDEVVSGEVVSAARLVDDGDAFLLARAASNSHYWQEGPYQGLRVVVDLQTFSQAARWERDGDKEWDAECGMTES